MRRILAIASLAVSAPACGEETVDEASVGGGAETSGSTGSAAAESGGDQVAEEGGGADAADETGGSDDSSDVDEGGSDDTGSDACPSPWTLEVVDEVAGIDADLSIAPSGSLDIVYVGGVFPSSHELRHARREASDWEVTPFLALAGSTFPEIPSGRILDGALDPDGELHLVYRNAFKPWHVSGPAFSGEPMWPVGVSAQHLNPKIAFGPDGALEVVLVNTYGFTDNPTGVVHATWGDDEWNLGSVAPEGGSDGVDFALDDDGGAHVVYVAGQYGGGAPTYATNVDGDFETSAFEGGPTWASAVAIAVTPGGSPRVAVLGGDETDSGLWVAEHDGDSWTTSLVFELGDVPEPIVQRIGLEVDDAGDAHVAFTTDAAVHYAHGQGDEYTVEPVGDPTQWGDHPSLALDPDGVPHVAFRELTTDTALIHAVRDCP